MENIVGLMEEDLVSGLPSETVFQRVRASRQVLGRANRALLFWIEEIGEQILRQMPGRSWRKLFEQRPKKRERILFPGASWKKLIVAARSWICGKVQEGRSRLGVPHGTPGPTLPHPVHDSNRRSRHRFVALSSSETTDAAIHGDTLEYDYD
ncbi:MAG: hypothetical protein HYU64_11315 [Armatimonadetes bacterium]|nr:hypothetical protein [Armatimonadota bacterium]